MDRVFRLFLATFGSKAFLLLGMCAALICGLDIFVGSWRMAASIFKSGPYLHDDAELGKLQAEVDPLIERLKQYCKGRGRYPETLESCGERTPTTRFGPWHYTCYREGQAFALTLGDYGRNGFVVLWDSPGGDWYVGR